MYHLHKYFQNDFMANSHVSLLCYYPAPHKVLLRVKRHTVSEELNRAPNTTYHKVTVKEIIAGRASAEAAVTVLGTFVVVASRLTSLLQLRIFLKFIP